MPNAIEGLLSSYEDYFLPEGHPQRLEAERAYRESFLSGAKEAAMWLRPEFDITEFRAEQRQIARDNAKVERDGIYYYRPGHEVLAAHLRGRHHAIAFVEQAFTRPDANQYRYRVEIERWLAEVERWAAEPLDFDELSDPPRPDDDWPHVRKDTPVAKPVVAHSALKPVGNLEWLRMGAKPVFASAAKVAPSIPQEPTEPMTLPTLTLRELVARYPELRPPVIHGLLREGETMNVIASPKTGKSWLVNDLAIAVATGGVWLDTFPCEQGRVLIIDNELHTETSAHRLPKVVAARGLSFDTIGDRIEVANLRGELKDIFGLGRYFAAMEPGKFRVVVIDAFYRALPRDTDENDNGAMAQIYNVLDGYAAKLGCCFILIHHSSKGIQAGKSVTDVGAGAGAQSRAADSHLILRPHEQPDVAVLDAAVRSWPPIQPICLRWTFPVWSVAAGLDPVDLKSDKPRRKPKPVVVEPAKPVASDWNAELFAAAFVSSEPATKLAIEQAALREIPSERRVEKLLKLAEQQGLIHRWKFGASQAVQFATLPQPKNASKEVAG